ncbi:MAG: hypothetical protein WCJ39_07645 [bacterium]
MQRLRYYLRTYPTRIKYGLLLLDLFAMIIAIRMYVNYLAIQTTIENTIFERETKMAELAFTRNFLAYYENSDFARFFLQHENNMLSAGEYIIKLDTSPPKTATGNVSSPKAENIDTNFVSSPEASWQKFLHDKANN